MSTRKFYLSGPMSGMPESNVPAFNAAAAHLRSLGVSVVSPAELDEEFPIENPTWARYLARDIVVVAEEVDGLILLPGWEKSDGAKLECYIGLLKNKTFDLYVGVPGNTDRTATRNVGREYIRARIL